MSKLWQILSTVGVLIPASALAHEDPTHSRQTVLQQIFHIDHIILYGLPTLLAAILVYRHRKKLASSLSKFMACYFDRAK